MTEKKTINAEAVTAKKSPVKKTAAKKAAVSKGQKIRISLKAFDHRLIDESVSERRAELAI